MRKTRPVLLLAAAVMLLAVALWIHGKEDPVGSQSQNLRLAQDAGSQQQLAQKKAMIPVVKGQQLSGVILGVDGSPVVGASLTAQLELGAGVRGKAPKDAGLASTNCLSGVGGAFSFSGLLIAGRYRLVVEAANIMPSELRFVEAPGQGLEILVARSVSLGGQVRFAGAPQENIDIFLHSEAGTLQRQVKSGKQGFFEFKQLPEGQFKIYASSEGRAAAVQVVSRLGPGPFADVSLALENAYSLSGRVFELGSTRLGLVADVVLEHAEGVEIPRRVVSGADGSFVIHGVLAGPWLVKAKRRGYLSSSVLSFSAESVGSLQLVLEPGAAVSGTVVSASGAPLEGAMVVLQGQTREGGEIRYSSSALLNRSGELGPSRLLPKGELGVLLGPIPMPPARGSSSLRVAHSLTRAQASPIAPAGEANVYRSDRLGRFSISGVEAGGYRLSASHVDWATTVTDVFRLATGQRRRGQTVSLHSGSRLVGMVSDTGGAVVAGASILVAFDDGRQSLMTVSDSEGRFEYPPLAGGLTVTVSAAGHESVRQIHRLAQGGMIASKTQVSFRLARTDAFLSGNLVDPDGLPVQSAKLAVEARVGGLPGPSHSSDESGVFRVDGVSEGKHWVAIRHTDFPTLRIQMSSAAPLETALRFGAGLLVSVRDKHSQASIQSATVSIQHELTKGSGKARPGEHQRKQSTSDTGEARFMAISEGRYLLQVQKAGYAAVERSLALRAGTRIGEVTENLVVELLRGATIAGLVFDHEGNRLVEAQLTIGTLSVRSDKDGRFRAENVPSGKVGIRIQKGEVYSVTELELSAGEERVTLELVLDDGS